MSAPVPLGEVGVDLVYAHVFGVTLVVEEDIFSDPVEVGTFGAQGVTART